ncbi:MAG: S8 family serine peptidase, partial [Verrucomicrobia bacterium]|nr:S8 family serine peptidase [Verrucomicrobiota bacterium]
VNEAEVNGVEGYDDDGNGYIDDVRGWDFHHQTNTPLDDNMHGTHVAGILASSGENSPTITNIINSATNANFHGMAPESELLSLTIDLLSGPLESDEELQTVAAEYNYISEGRTNAMISNNSWNYPNSQEYGLASASFDAAVRDALPYMEGEQPMVYVFSAGNAGNGDQSGRGGSPGSILAPATAKNVITVGAIETLRFITNEVVVGFVDQIITNEMGVAETNQIPVLDKAYLVDTDSATQVASFSSRGNVGVGIEGEGGRFKPDVVAPGTYVVSTRSSDWENPEGLQDTILNRREGISVNPGDLSPITIFVPSDGVEVRVRILENEDAPLALPDLPIYVALGRFPSEDDFAGFSEVTLTPEAPAPLTLVPGNIYFISVGNDTERTVVFDLETAVVTEEEDEGFYKGLGELNDGLEPHYRFESGTSMAAPVVSGTLALMQQHLTENGYNPSPALLKALLINGARSSGTVYDYQIDPLINYQGWGLPNLNNSMPQSFLETEGNRTSSVQFFDQDPERAIATSDSVSWNLNISTNGARAFPLRVSLVWTDPPGNPAAGVKLVNDLDLVVSNAVSGEVFYGNDFTEVSQFTRMSPSNSVPISDVVNNVENVYINGPLTTNYVVSVIGRRVNVNTVFGHPDGVVQDFALVISSGDDSELEAPFELEPLETPLPPVFPQVIAITNGIPRLEDRVGANAPLLGTTNGLAQQWQFYMFTNSLPSTNDVGFTNGPNVAFVTFLPPELGKPRVSEADIDLYVSRDAGLLDLDEGVIASASNSLNQGGTEVVLFENQPLGDDVIYYVGVKSEDHQGAQFALVGLSQEEPFDFTDDNGNRVFRGIPLNQGIIPDGTPGSPGAGLGIAIGNPLNGLTVQSVVVEQTVFHEDIGDLLGSISHNGVSAVLNNHTLLSPQGSTTVLDAVYDDFGIFANSIPSDGPGNLINFIGENGVGVWLMTMVDNALSQTGSLSGFRVVATPNQLLDDNGLFATVQGETFRYFFVEVPPDASALTVNLTEFDLPLDLYLRHEEIPTQTLYDKRALGVDGENIVSVTITPRDIPPLNAGRYFIGVYNPNPVAVDFRLTFNIERNLIIDSEQPFFPDEFEVPILDFGQTDSAIFVPDSRPVAEAKIGLRIDHPRLSDLSVHLVSPDGTRVLLSENRGGNINTGFGSGTSEKPIFAGFSDDEEDADTLIKFAQGPFTTNAVISVTPISGFEQAPTGIQSAGESFPADNDGNMWDVISGRARILDQNAPEGDKFINIFSSRIAITIPTPPGRKFDLFYSTRSSAGRGSPVGLAFLEGRRAQVVDGSIRWRRNTPIRFVPVSPESLLEFTFVRGRPAMSLDDIEIRDAAAVKYYFPEEPLETFKGESALGDWSLEIQDTREGAIAPPPILQNWQLLLSLANTNVQAVTLRNGQCFASNLGPDEVHYFIVETPRIATMATNWLTG